MGSSKRQRGSQALDRGTSSASIDECLPQEILEEILGKLDRPTLCTARLASRAFCAAASGKITSVTVRRPSQAVSLERFSRISHVTVHDICDDQSLAELDPRLQAVITQLRLSQGNGMELPDLPGMPKLRELHVDNMAQVWGGSPHVWEMYGACMGRIDGAVALHQLTNLEAIRLDGCTPPVAKTVMTMTRLTSLCMGWVTRPDDSTKTSWFKHATGLRKLQSLQIAISPKALPRIGNLTGLTGLTWMGYHYTIRRTTYSIDPLSNLTRLESLDIADYLRESNLAIACSLRSGSLAHLCLSSCVASGVCGRLLARQTALTHLTVRGDRLCNLRHMGGVRMELLKSLELVWPHPVDAEGLEVLGRATSLTHLRIRMGIPFSHVGLSQTLGQLTHLRCLQLMFDFQDVKILDVRSAVSPLMALTELQIHRGYLENSDLRELLCLAGLQVLDLMECRLTDSVVPDLAVLTNLKTLKLRRCGVSSLARATNIINPLRAARGWPPVDAHCE